MKPTYKTFYEITHKELEETLNDAAKEGWVLMGDTIRWDNSHRVANFVMIKDTVVVAPPTTEAKA